MKSVIAVACGALLCLGAVALGDPYLFTYYPPGSPYGAGVEIGGPYPEDQGWGWYIEGGGANRAIVDYAFKLWTADPMVSDQYVWDGQEQMTPGPDELFYVEWQMRVFPESDDGDVVVWIAADDYGGVIDLGFGPDYFWSFRDYHSFPIEATVYHTYRIESVDLETYEFYIDGLYRYTGFFDTPTGFTSVVLFGDGYVGAASSSAWEYVIGGTMSVSPRADLDGDGHVDLLDFATFARCYAGAAVSTVPQGCLLSEFLSADRDQDSDVDLADFGLFAAEYGT